MRAWVVIPLLIVISTAAHAQKCTLAGRGADVDFPNLEDLAVESYAMTVEYTTPNANQTDYYEEFYDCLDRKGRLDSQQSGESGTYMYVTESWESWRIGNNACELYNITDALDNFKHDQSEWLHVSGEENNRTVGPSAMFKVALDVWRSKDRSSKMAYMGIAKEKIRGIEARYWRRCKDDGSFVNYYFTTVKEENPSGLDVIKTVPLKVVFGGARKDEEFDLSDQEYDIMSFRPFIPRSQRPFDLPKGKGCRRGPLVVAPTLPNYESSSLDFSAEVTYQKVDYNSRENVQRWSYYSTLRYALDQQSQHVAYYYSTWTKTKTGKEPETDVPEYTIYDMKHHFGYKMKTEPFQCEIVRDKNFYAYYRLPENGGRISLTDPTILYPNSEFQFMSEGVNRGLKVNVFERVVNSSFPLTKDDGTVDNIPKVIITHSYLQDNVVERNVVSIKNALTQVQFLFFGRKDKVLEILTFNFFQFSTEILDKRSLFNIKSCFKNDDDYLWVTIGFDVDETLLPKIENRVPAIQNSVMIAITRDTELSPARIPIILVDFNQGLYVTAMILGKNPIMLDFEEAVADYAIVDAAEEDGVESKEDCALSCLEEKDNCWGFSICGAKCAYGTVLAAKAQSKKGCQLYRRWDNTTYIPSKEMMVNEISNRVKNGQHFKLVVVTDDNTMVQAEAVSIEWASPGEDDKLFNRLGNQLNTRMKVLKTGAKLRGVGAEVKDKGKLRYDECQKECLDYKDCETASYCLTGQKCVLTSKYGDDLKPEEIENDNMCNLITRKYADHFDRTPGVVLSLTAQEVVMETNAENCARACLKSTKFNCLSFDHCPTDDQAPCKLHTVHYPNAKTREQVQEKSTSCGHYFRKYSTEFKKNPERRTAGSSLPPLTNLTIEECAKNCVEFGKGVCYGFDFCQGSTLLATSCTLLDKNNYQTVENKMCTNFIREIPQAATLPYSNGYAGGIGFLCFLIGGIAGALLIFGIAYLKVNRR